MIESSREWLKALAESDLMEHIRVDRSHRLFGETVCVECKTRPTRMKSKRCDDCGREYRQEYMRRLKRELSIRNRAA